MSPCPKMNVEKTKTAHTFLKQIMTMTDVLGMHVLTGENWDKVRSMICSHLGVTWCQQDIQWKPEFFSRKALTHLFQNGLQDRFQEYSHDFTSDRRHRITADIPIQNIKEMPISIMTSDKDDVCPAEQAQWVFRKIKTLDKRIFLIKNMAHERFVTTSDEEYISDIQRALKVG